MLRKPFGCYREIDLWALGTIGSHCTLTHLSIRVGGGSYGFRARASVDPIRFETQGVVPDCDDSNYAEMYAILKGLEYICQTYDRVDGVGVRSDSQTACNLLRYGAKLHHRSDFRDLQLKVLAVLESKSQTQGSVVKIKLEWVKGHQTANQGKGWLNNRVDALARSASKEIP